MLHGVLNGKGVQTRVDACAHITKSLCCTAETTTRAPHSSPLAWTIPRTEEPGGLQSMGSLGVGHDWATSLSLSCIGQGNGNPLQCSCLENPRVGGAWWSAVCGVAQSRTWLRRLSSSRNHNIVKLLKSNVCLVLQSGLTQQPHGLQLTRLLCPWNSLGRNIGVGCHVPLQVKSNKN